jgi:hypothetical protein
MAGVRIRSKRQISALRVIIPPLPRLRTECTVVCCAWVYCTVKLATLGMISAVTQEAKYIEGWPSTTSAWAGWSRFDIPADRYGGVHSLLRWPSRTLGSPTCH